MTGETIGPSKVLGGRYELLELVGSGGMASVWRAFDSQLRRIVAVKVIAKRLAKDPDFRRRFEREAKHVASLSHPSIASVYDFGVDDDRAFIVMEHVDGKSLRDHLSLGDPMSIDEVISLAETVLAALEHAHLHGIVHRDIKPANILIAPDGSKKVVDFGIAKANGDTTEITIRGSMVGTANYSSPEQLAGEPVGPASDFYSLGCVLYECLVGSPPFQADDLARMVIQQRFADPPPFSSKRSDIPVPLDTAILRALEKDSDHRFSSARSMLEALHGVTSKPKSLETPADIQARLNTPALIGSSKKERDMGPGNGTRTSTRPLDRFLALDRENLVTSEDHSSSAGRPGMRLRRLLGARVGPSLRRHRIAGVVMILVLASVLAAGIGIFVLGIRSTAPSVSSSNATISPGGLLEPGQSLTSQNGRFRLSMEPDGDLETSEVSRSVPTWESETEGSAEAYAIMQSDGDFVVYPKGDSAPSPGQPTQALWSSGTSGNPGATVHLENNGNLVIRSHLLDHVLWQNDAIPGSVGSTLLPGQDLHPAQYLESPDGHYRLFDDSALGGLQLSPANDTSCILWQAVPQVLPISSASMQTDGNLVLSPLQSRTAEWSSRTSGNPGATLVLEDGGTLVVLSSTGLDLWQEPTRTDHSSRC